VNGFDEVGLQYNAGWCLPLFEDRDECMRKRDKANVIDVHLVLEPFQVKASWVT
jgi:hypothetical protein